MRGALCSKAEPRFDIDKRKGKAKRQNLAR
jgi:hypothetical protein